MMSVKVCRGFVSTMVNVGGGLLEWCLLSCSFRAQSELTNMFGLVEYLQ
jgi:hypothetical protein